MKNNNKNLITLFIVILCFITTLISVGFSALNQNLNVSGDVDYEEDDKVLYNVFKRAADMETYAKEYTGDHRDSFTEEPTKSIYFWYPKNQTYINSISNKMNVIFGDFCWQMFRTTDTGGVKLLYTGIYSGGKCNLTYQIGLSRFNANSSSPADVGYMYNTRYAYNSKLLTYTSVFTQKTMTSSSNYYYGTGVTYSDGKYTLTGTTQNTWENTYSSSKGLYTCRSTTNTPCSTVYYIAGGISTYMVGFEMTNGKLLNYYNTNLVFGTNYTENNGTYTLTNTTTIPREDWYNNYSTYKNYYTCGDDSTTCTDLKYIVQTNSYYYYSLSLSNNYIYAKDFTYDSGTNTYTLSSDRYQSWNMTDTDITNLATHHYTCFNQTGSCQTLSYVYYARVPSEYVSYIFYINLTGGKSVEDAVNEMLYDDNVNTTDSVIKAYIDNWYLNNMTSYTSYLEDTIFCYNRSQLNSSENGWNPDGGSISTSITFDNNSLSCTNDTDKFSVSNNKAKLTYPVGLASYIELYSYFGIRLFGMATLYDTCLGSPAYFSEMSASVNYANSAGGYGSYQVKTTYAVRPVVSLKPGTEYESGTGSKDDPYVVALLD